nr:polysaccharide biosynthesis protein [Lentilactobacillus kisonensis]
MVENDQHRAEVSRDQMLSASAWMTAGSILSRFLGAVYIIPWSIWFGNYFLRGNALYGLGYNIYSFFLIAAIAGIPSAIAKQVAHYNALNEYGIGIRLYKRGLVLAVGTGVISAAILYFGAPLIDGGNPNVIPVLHSLAWAILIIPTMSLTRGYFQGYQQMAPSAISQFVEQLVRVIYMLVTAFLIMQVFHGDWVKAVSQSTFAAFVGALAGMVTLAVYYLRRREDFRSLVAHSNNQLHVAPKALYHEIITQAVPFIILGAGITIFMLIDQFTFFKVMRQATDYSNNMLSDLYALFAVNANKLIMITISLASALAITAVPLLSVALTRGDKQEIAKQNSNVLTLFLFVMIPAALGMCAIAGPLNRLFYGQAHQALGANVLTFSSITSIPMGLFVVISAVMQGLSQNKRAVKFFLVGTIVKLIFQWPCIYYLGAFGPLVSTGIGLCVTNWLIIRSLNRQLDLNDDC